MTLSAFLSSVLSGHTSHRRGSVRESGKLNERRSQSVDREQESLRRCRTFRNSFPLTEIAIPAMALRPASIAAWARDQRVAVDVRSGEELAVALAAGIHLTHVTVFADEMSPSDLKATINLGVGRIVAGSVQEIEMLRSSVAQRVQDVILRMTDAQSPTMATADGGANVSRGFRLDSNEADKAVAAVLDHQWLNLVGLHCEVGSLDNDFVSYPSAIGHLIAEMAQIRMNHNKLLTRLGLGAHRVSFGDWTSDLPQLATQIDESLDDACATMRFPRPVVMLSATLGIIERTAA